MSFAQEQGRHRSIRNTAGNLFDSVYSKHSVHNVSEFWGVVVILAVLFLSMVARYNQNENLPQPQGLSNILHHPNAFLADRAWKDLKVLTDFGPRTAGSHSNEVLAVEFLKREISYIQKTAHKSQRVEFDLQVVSGSLHTEFRTYTMTNMYRNIQNVVVKLNGQMSSEGNENTSALLINCHFDTVPTSPGANDNGVNCVVMLEILRVLSRTEQRNKHAIIFLFNGAEETGLQASHGFITQHKWAKEVKAFINLEAVGSGGKEMLFQSSSKNPSLMKWYAKAVPYPSAQVAAEEIFQSGIIPSDTDFRIFRDYGNLTGLDFAHYINGYRYHTKHDHIDYISKGVIQHTGDNILQLSKIISNSDDMGTTTDLQDEAQVYFDILGIFFVTYSVKFATLFNYAIVSCSVLIPYLILSKATTGINKKHLRYEIFLGFLINVIILVTSNALCYAIAYDLDMAGKSMTWYSNPWVCVPTYCLTTVFVECVVYLLFNHKAPLSLSLQVQARLIGTSFFWGILAAALTSARIRTAYLIIVPLVVTLFFNILIGLKGYQNSIRKWLYLHLIGQILVVLWATNLHHMLVDVFIPTAGRSGSRKNPDILIGILSSSLTFFTTSYLSPLVTLLKKRKNMLIALFAVYIMTRFYFINFTRVGFPYQDDSSGAPKMQRHYITHTLRTLYDKEGNIRYTDSGFWMLDLDRNTRKTIESLTMPEQLIPQDENILCRTEPFCGLPLLTVNQLKTEGFWVPGPAPIIKDTFDIRLVSQERLSSKIQRMNFILTGSGYVSMHLSFKEKVSLDNWSLTSNLPLRTEFNERNSYFVMITQGLESEPLNVTLDLRTSEENYTRSLMSITLVTYRIESSTEHTPSFAKILSKIPRWAHVTPSIAELKAWTF